MANTEMEWVIQGLCPRCGTEAETPGYDHPIPCECSEAIRDEYESWRRELEEELRAWRPYFE